MTLTSRQRLKLKDADYSPDIQLRIRSKDPYFEADCQLGSYPFRFLIELSMNDMKDICHGLQAKLDALRLAFEDDGADKSERANTLQSLAEEGHGALVKIFAPKGFRTKLEETLHLLFWSRGHRVTLLQGGKTSLGTNSSTVRR